MLYSTSLKKSYHTSLPLHKVIVGAYAIVIYAAPGGIGFISLASNTHT